MSKCIGLPILKPQVSLSSLLISKCCCSCLFTAYFNTSFENTFYIYILYKRTKPCLATCFYLSALVISECQFLEIRTPYGLTAVNVVEKR